MKVLLRDGFALVEPVEKKQEGPFISSRPGDDITHYRVVDSTGDFASGGDDVLIEGSGEQVDFEGRKLIKIKEDQIYAIINRKDGVNV